MKRAGDRTIKLRRDFACADCLRERVAVFLDRSDGVGLLDKMMAQGWRPTRAGWIGPACAVKRDQASR